MKRRAFITLLGGAAAAWQTQLGMDTAHPMHHENDLSALFLEIGDHPR